MGLFNKRAELEELTNAVAKLKDENNRLREQCFKHRIELAHERNNRLKVIEYLDRVTITTENPDGTYTHKITSFVRSFSDLFINRKDLGIEGEL